MPGNPADWPHMMGYGPPGSGPPGMVPYWQQPPPQVPPRNSAGPSPSETERSLPPDVIEYQEDGKYKDMINMTLTRIVTDLKALLHKDLGKRMVEAHAYKQFQEWWDREANKHRIGGIIETKMDTGPAPAPEEESSALDTFGLGFRAALPKMPSFKRKIKPPSPPREEADADEEEPEPEEEEPEENDNDFDDGQLISLFSNICFSICNIYASVHRYSNSFASIAFDDEPASTVGEGEKEL